MSETPEIVNRVAMSGLVTLDLEELYLEGERISFDMADHLHQRIVLKEKEFREAMRSHDWSRYEGKYVALHCSEDAIVPTWAFMLVASRLAPLAKKVVAGNPEQLEATLFHEVIGAMDLSSYQGKRVVIKGCSNRPVPMSAYVRVTERLVPIAISVMYGEPCSTVPVFKGK
jgi:hypothetical protein